MASEFRNNWQMASIGWLAATILLAFIAGTCCAMRTAWWILFAIASVISAIAMMSNVSRIWEKVRYVMEATLSGDFSYKFPTSDVNREEREINEMLNGIVEHFERLTNEVRRNEAFLGRLINLTEVGLAVADANGDIRLHNDAALRLLERQALTNVCQIPEQAYSDLDIRKSNVTVSERSFTLFTISDLSRKMQAVEVESWEKLTRVLTHEIMNSLTPIQSIAETMIGKTTAQEATEAFETISSSSRSLMQFVRNFRE
ncbi:MAG: PAS domain-containing protein, partial [Muribaculaceae bacterium]|nr:PAS domain-containing protein [Muribaculaceae bacterium]